MGGRLVPVEIVFAALFVVALAGLLDYLDSRGAPSAELCATQWNHRDNVKNQTLASAQHFEIAVVTGSLTKERFPGCGVLFRSADGHPWLLFAGWLHAGRVVRWDLVSGERWGFDSPEGGPDTPNAVVTTDGRVRLIEA